MKFRVHFSSSDGTEDYFDIVGETIEEVRKIAGQELFKRTGSIQGGNAWSEPLNDSSRRVRA